MSEYINLGSGLAIYKQKQSKNYYLYLRTVNDPVPKEYRKSLRTDDQQKAMKLAYKHQAVLESNNDVEELFPKTANVNQKIFKSLLARLDKQTQESKQLSPQSKVHARCLRNIIIPAFSNRTLKSINRQDIREVIDSATNKTKRNNITKAIKMFFEEANDTGYIKYSDIPEISGSKKIIKTNSRIPFTKDEISRIKRRLPLFKGSAGLKDTSKLYRFMLEYVFDFLLLVGCRPGREIDELKFNCITRTTKESHTEYRLTFNGTKTDDKNGKSRSIQINEEALWLIVCLHREFNPSLYPKDERTTIKGAPYLKISKQIDHQAWIDIFFASKDKEQYVFRNPAKPTSPLTWPKYFNQLMNEMKMSGNLYNCRHYFITEQLKKKTPIYDLALHCGTSIEMIESYYSDMKAYDAGGVILQNMTLVQAAPIDLTGSSD